MAASSSSSPSSTFSPTFSPSETVNYCGQAGTPLMGPPLAGPSQNDGSQGVSPSTDQCPLTVPLSVPHASHRAAMPAAPVSSSPGASSPEPQPHPAQPLMRHEVKMEEAAARAGLAGLAGRIEPSAHVDGLSPLASTSLGTHDCQHLWRALWHDYTVERVFVDLELWVGQSESPIACHRIVMASVSALLQRILSEAERDLHLLERTISIQLPDHTVEDVKQWVDFVYSHWDPSNPGTAADFLMPQILARDLGIKGNAFGPASNPRGDDPTLTLENEAMKRKTDASYSPHHSKRLKSDDDLEDDHQEFKCSECGKIFPTKMSMQKHVRKCSQAVETLDLKQIQTMITTCSGTLEHIKVEDAFSRNEHKRQTLWKSKKACVNVTGNVDLEDCLDDEVGDRKVERRKASFRAILGVFKPENKSDVIYARPLAYSDPRSTEDVTNQFEETINLLKMLFGFSDADIYTFPDLVHKHENVPISIETLNERKNRTLINFRQQSVEAIKSVYTSEAAKISRCYEHHEGRRIQSIKRQPDAKVILKPDLELKDLNNVACCLWNEGQPNAIMYPLLPANRKIERSKSSAFCLRVLLDVWCTNEVKFPFSSFILEMYTTICDTVSLKEAVDEVLPLNMIDSISQWTPAYQHQIPPSSQPPQLSIPNQHFYATPNQILQQPLHHHQQQQQQQQEEHIPMQSDQGLQTTMVPTHESIPITLPPGINPQHKDEECNCDIIFDDHVQKRRHILLNHSHGKYQQCKQCSFIGTQAQIQWHQSNAHKEYNCDICGKVFKTHHSALEHATKHDSFHCNICNIDIIGKRKYRIHMDRSHTGTWRCQLCNSEFNCQSSLRNHEKRIHTPDDQKPHRCEECGKGFIIKTALRTHMMNVHIKTRPYACQYGCGATYNDVSNRAHHENKKHGAVFNPDKHKVIVQSHHLGST